MAWRILSFLSLLPALLITIAASAQQGAKAFRDCPHCPELVPATPGSFVMGDPERRAVEEQPLRRVIIEYRFAYSKDKVSFRDWKQCVVAGACPSLGATGTASLDPVVMVSWLDVNQYLSWLSQGSGVEYRLLSEAEWEYLARTSPPTPFPIPASGLEWTSDCWHRDYVGAPKDGSSWDTDGDCRYHVARGHRMGEAAPSVTKRYRFLFNARDADVGFRVARTIRE